MVGKVRKVGWKCDFRALCKQLIFSWLQKRRRGAKSTRRLEISTRRVEISKRRVDNSKRRLVQTLWRGGF